MNKTHRVRGIRPSGGPCRAAARHPSRCSFPGDRQGSERDAPPAPHPSRAPRNVSARLPPLAHRRPPLTGSPVELPLSNVLCPALLPPLPGIRRPPLSRPAAFPEGLCRALPPCLGPDHAADRRDGCPSRLPRCSSPGDRQAQNVTRSPKALSDGTRSNMPPRSVALFPPNLQPDFPCRISSARLSCPPCWASLRRPLHFPSGGVQRRLLPRTLLVGSAHTRHEPGPRSSRTEDETFPSHMKIF